NLQSPPLARPSGCSHHSVRGRRAARPFTPRISRRVAQAGLWHRYVTDLGNCHGWTCTSKITVFSASPSRTGLSDKISRLRPREVARPIAQAYQSQHFVQVPVGEP